MRLVLLVAVSVATLAQAQRARPPDAPLVLAQVVPRNEAIELAAQQVDAGDFEDAVRTVERGLEQPDLTDDQLAELYRLLGLAHLYLGNEDKARDAFEKLLQARPDYEVPRSAPPKIRQLYARLREDVRKRRVRPVTLTLTPVGHVEGGAPVTVAARIEDLALGARPRLFFRRAGVQSYSSTDFARSKVNRTDFAATIPAYEVPREDAAYELEYYVEVADAAQRRLAGRGDPYNPLAFRVASRQAEAPVAGPPSLLRSPWLWIGLGVAAAAATTAIVVVATTQQTATLPITIQIEGTP